MSRPSLDNPRGFPRWFKNAKPKCPVHSIAMKSRQEPIPPFLSICLGSKRDIRTVWYCPVNGCHRVTHGDVKVAQGMGERQKDSWMSLI